MSMLFILLVSTVWHNTFFYLFTGTLLLAIFFGIAITKQLFKRNSDMKLIQQQYLAKVDNIRKEYTETVERLRQDMLKHEEDRTRQWMESEKETLHVLNGVSTILELGDRLTKSDNDKILKRLTEVEGTLEQLVELHGDIKKNLEPDAADKQ